MLARRLAEEEEAAQRVAMVEAEAAFPSLSVAEQLRRDEAESRRLQHEREAREREEAERQREAAERKRAAEAKAVAAKPKRLMDFIASQDSSPASLFGPAGSTSLGLKALRQEPQHREPVSQRAVAAPDLSGRFGGGGGGGGGGGAPLPQERSVPQEQRGFQGFGGAGERKGERRSGGGWADEAEEEMDFSKGPAFDRDSRAEGDADWRRRPARAASAAAAAPREEWTRGSQ